MSFFLPRLFATRPEDPVKLCDRPQKLFCVCYITLEHTPVTSSRNWKPGRPQKSALCAASFSFKIMKTAFLNHFSGQR